MFKSAIITILISCLFLSSCSSYNAQEYQEEIDALTSERDFLEEELSHEKGYTEDLLNTINSFEETLKFSNFLKQQSAKEISFNETWRVENLFDLTFTSYDKSDNFLKCTFVSDYEASFYIPDFSLLILVRSSQGDIYYFDDYLWNGENDLMLEDYTGQQIELYIFANTKTKQHIAKLKLTC